MIAGFPNTSLGATCILWYRPLVTTIMLLGCKKMVLLASTAPVGEREGREEIHVHTQALFSTWSESSSDDSPTNPAAIDLKFNSIVSRQTCSEGHFNGVLVEYDSRLYHVWYDSRSPWVINGCLKVV